MFGNNNFLKRSKKKYSDDNNVNTSKRTIGPISMDFKKVLNNQEQQLKNIISSSEGSKDIDFDKNVNVVINPYCIILNKKQGQNLSDNANNTGTQKQNQKNKLIIIEENASKNEVQFYKNKKLISTNKIGFTNIEKNNDSKKSDQIKVSEE